MKIKTTFYLFFLFLSSQITRTAPNFNVNNRESILRETNINSQVLIVTFGGLHHAIVIPMYEFYNILKAFNVKKLFVRDMHQSWYHRGISENGNISTTCQILQKEIRKTGVKRVVFFGNSSGGYAALLFGRLLHVDEVHAFVPQTSSGAMPMNYPFVEPEFFDLPTVFQNVPNEKTRFHIHYSDDGPNDIRQADRLRGYNVVHHVYKKKGDHTMVRRLRDEGILQRIIKNAVGGQ